MENIRVDSLIAERFSFYPRFVNMYAYCGFSQITELFPQGDLENDFVGFKGRDSDFNPTEESELNPRNAFSPSEKLHLALEMVEPLVAMHTMLDSPVVHDDLDLGQYLWADDEKRNIKINDFNRAGA